MRIQSLERPKFLGTEIALVAPAIPGGFGGPGVDSSRLSILVRIRKQPLCYEMVCVVGADLLVDGVTSDSRSAGARLKMDRHGGDSRKSSSASRAMDRLADVFGRAKMLGEKDGIRTLCCDYFARLTDNEHKPEVLKALWSESPSRVLKA